MNTNFIQDPTLESIKLKVLILVSLFLLQATHKFRTYRIREHVKRKQFPISDKFPFKSTEGFFENQVFTLYVI